METDADIIDDDADSKEPDPDKMDIDEGSEDQTTSDDANSFEFIRKRGTGDFILIIFVGCSTILIVTSVFSGFINGNVTLLDFLFVLCVGCFFCLPFVFDFFYGLIKIDTILKC